MSRDQIKVLLADWEAKLAAASQNLIALGNNVTYQRLKGLQGQKKPTLNGITQQRVHDAIENSGPLWDNYRFIEQAVERARELFATIEDKYFPPASVLSEMELTLAGDGIELPPEQIPLEKRSLLSDTEKRKQTSLARLLAEMIKSFEAQRDVVAAIGKAWTTLPRKLEALQKDIGSCRLAVELGQRRELLGEVGQIEARFKTLCAEQGSDPLGVEKAIPEVAEQASRLKRRSDGAQEPPPAAPAKAPDAVPAESGKRARKSNSAVSTGTAPPRAPRRKAAQSAPAQPTAKAAVDVQPTQPVPSGTLAPGALAGDLQDEHKYEPKEPDALDQLLSEPVANSDPLSAVLAGQPLPAPPAVSSPTTSAPPQSPAPEKDKLEEMFAQPGAHPSASMPPAAVSSQTTSAAPLPPVQEDKLEDMFAQPSAPQSKQPAASSAPPMAGQSSPAPTVGGTQPPGETEHRLEDLFGDEQDAAASKPPAQTAPAQTEAPPDRADTGSGAPEEAEDPLDDLFVAEEQKPRRKKRKK